MKSNVEFVKYLYRRLPVSALLPGTYYCTDGDIGTIPAHYLMGTTGQQANQWRLDYAYTKYYSKPDYGEWSRQAYDNKTQPWISEGAYLYDCEGLLDAFVEQDNNAAGCYVNFCGIRDEDAYNYIMQNGALAAGACVFKRNSAGRIHHVGFIAGRGAGGVPLVIEAKSFVDGIVMSTLNDGWNEYGIPNRVLTFQQGQKTRFAVTVPMMQGEKFELMQRALLANGYNPGTIDGKWGNNSQAAFDDMMDVNRQPVNVKVEINGQTVINNEY
jgi:hypothetical protein